MFFFLMVWIAFWCFFVIVWSTRLRITLHGLTFWPTNMGLFVNQELPAFLGLRVTNIVPNKQSVNNVALQNHQRMGGWRSPGYQAIIVEKAPVCFTNVFASVGFMSLVSLLKHIFQPTTFTKVVMRSVVHWKSARHRGFWRLGGPTTGYLFLS